MSDKTKLEGRMKELYEDRSKTKLTRRLPTLIRLDGKAFHTYTRKLDKPFDEGLIEDMILTTQFLCEQIQGAKCGYTQSDEITILLTDYDNITTNAWYDYSVQKMTSVAASLATAKFNQLRMIRQATIDSGVVVPSLTKDDMESISLAFFDARVFQIPEKEEVVNCFIWRQRDAEKNSVSMLAQSLYSQKELNGVKTEGMQELCFQKGQNWNDLHYSKKRGSFIIKKTYINGKIPKIGVNSVTEIGDYVYYPNKTNGKFPNEKGQLLKWTLPDGKEFDRLIALENGFSFPKSWYKNYDPYWMEVEIEKIKSKWESVETPIFSQDRESILKFL